MRRGPETIARALPLRGALIRPSNIVREVSTTARRRGDLVRARMSTDLPPRYRLRATAGPLKGARFQLLDEVTIGRSSQVEVFVADGGVSRRHAKVTPQGDGHVLMDLGSVNGTVVDGERVHEHLLVPGDEFTVGGTTFAYELIVAEQPVAVDRGVYAVQGRKGEPVDRTIVNLGRDEARRAPELQRIDARGPSGTPYDGDVIGDVILYRNLRLRKLRGELLPEAVHRRFEALDTGLRLAPDGSGQAREFVRFACSFPAHLRFGDSGGNGFPIEVVDFGAGGARIRCTGLLLDPDELAWLAIELVTAQGPRMIVFTSRVVWMRAGEMGLVFSGAPGWSKHSGGAEQEDTLLVDRDDVPAARRAVQLRLAETKGDV
jgi:pSer/pThr/pTyr-binding forkhead associated (FHA) protein